MTEAIRTILITGCSTGIGHHAALGLKALGWRVFAAARKEADVARLAEEGFESLRLDYADEESIGAALGDVLERTGGRLDALFNNGSYAQAGALEDIDTAAMRAQFEANFFGWHELTRRVVPVMRQKGSGRIVFCSSVLGFVGARYRGAYVASKHAVEGYADSLRLELHGTGISVILIEPGPIASEFRRNAVDNIHRTIDIDGSVHAETYRRDLADRPDGQTHTAFRRGPDAVFAKLVRALDTRNPAPRYRVTVPTHIAAVLKRILSTRMLDRVLR